MLSPTGVPASLLELDKNDRFSLEKTTVGYVDGLGVRLGRNDRSAAINGLGIKRTFRDRSRGDYAGITELLVESNFIYGIIFRRNFVSYNSSSRVIAFESN